MRIKGEDVSMMQIEMLLMLETARLDGLDGSACEPGQTRASMLKHGWIESVDELIGRCAITDSGQQMLDAWREKNARHMGLAPVTQRGNGLKPTVDNHPPTSPPAPLPQAERGARQKKMNRRDTKDTKKNAGCEGCVYRWVLEKLMERVPEVRELRDAVAAFDAAVCAVSERMKGDAG